MKVLQVEDIEKSKKRKKILKGLSFSVGEREIVGLLGPNGSGKSTTIKCISGLYRTDRGRIRICGNDIKSNRLEALKQIGIAMEVPALYPELSGIQNLRMAATARKVPKERVEELAVFTDLGDRLLDRTGTYSMGMKMRLNLAIAIVDQPKLVILDEPTNGLDPEAVFRLRREIEEIRQRGSAVLISSHQLSEMEKIADRIVAIDDGIVCFDGKLDDLSGRFENLEEFTKICMEQIRMKAFLQNEIQLFFSRKNYLVWIVGALAVVFAYRFYYVTQYENYAQTVLEELEENAKDITIWESEYQRQCMELWGDNSAEKFAHASLLLNAWKQYEQTNIRLRYYWEQAWDENGIRRTVLEEDENLIAIEELGEEVEYTGIFRGSVADWRARMLLHKAYQQSGTEEPVCPVVPQAAWLWKEAFSGNSVLFLIFTVLIILLHFDAWANEFEYATCYRLYILPIKKEWLYLERFFVRVLVSVVCVGSAAGILFLLGTARYGTGGQMLLVISEQGTQTVISIWSLVREEILGMLLYIVFLTAAVLLISFIVKTKMNALMICAAFCMTGIVQTTASDGTGKGIVEWLPQLSALTLLMLLAGCILIRIRED